MMKFKGKEVPISKYSFYLHDSVADQFEEITKLLKLKNNCETFTRMVWHVYKELQQFNEWVEQKEQASKEITMNNIDQDIEC